MFICSIMANCPASVDKSGLLAKTLSPVSASVTKPYTPTFSKFFINEGRQVGSRALVFSYFSIKFEVNK